MKNGYKLDGHTIEYMNVNQHDHYVYDDAFISTKLTEDVLIQYSQTAKVIKSNEFFINRLRCSRRGLHYGANKSEQEIGVFKRVYKDDAKRHRLSFEVDIDRAIEVLSMTPEDVQDLPRGHALKHFVMQRTTVITYDKKLKQLRKAMKRQKSESKKAYYIAKIKAFKERQNRLDSYIEVRGKRAIKRISDAKHTTFAREEITSSFRTILNGLGYVPPETHVN